MGVHHFYGTLSQQWPNPIIKAYLLSARIITRTVISIHLLLGRGYWSKCRRHWAEEWGGVL